MTRTLGSWNFVNRNTNCTRSHPLPAMHRLRPFDSSRTNRRQNSLSPDHVFIEMYDAAAALHRAAAQEAQSGLPAVDIQGLQSRPSMHMTRIPACMRCRTNHFLSDEQTDSSHGPFAGALMTRPTRRLSFDPVAEAQAIFDEQMAMFGMPQDAPQQSGALDQPMYDPQMMQMLNPWMVPGMGPMM
jgi:hypothetical protein